MSVLQLALEHLKELSQPAVGVPLGRPLEVSQWDTCPEAKLDQPAVEIATKATGGAVGTVGTLGPLGTTRIYRAVGVSSPAALDLKESA